MISLPVLPAAPAAGHRLSAVASHSDGRQPTADSERPYPTPPADQTGPLWDALREVMDPEIPISLVDLGLIYQVRLDGETAHVDLTFTATACPCMVFIKQDIEERLLREDAVDAVRIREVWSPPWTKARVTPLGREQLKKLGVSL